VVYKALIEKCGLAARGGTTLHRHIREFDPELGRIDVKWNQLQRRELCKRLNVLNWEAMRPPAGQNMHTDVLGTRCSG